MKRVNMGIGCGPHLNPWPLLLSARRRGEGGKKRDHGAVTLALGGAFGHKLGHGIALR